jgi:hypothetical protein
MWDVFTFILLKESASLALLACGYNLQLSICAFLDNAVQQDAKI